MGGGGGCPWAAFRVSHNTHYDHGIVGVNRIRVDCRKKARNPTEWESGLDNAAVGDHGRSVCAMQILGGSHALIEDPIACVRRGAVMLRESERVDPSNPIAFYARGPRYESETAKRISRDRRAIAARLLRMVAP